MGDSRIRPIYDHSVLNGPKTIDELGLTLVHPFYGEKKRLELLTSNWKKYSNNVKDKLHIICVDDGGTPALHKLNNYLKRLDVNIDIYRITKDLKYNTPGALNLGITQAKTKYVLIMDSDCTFEPEEMDQLFTVRPEPRCFHYFRRKRITEHEGWAKLDRFLPCTILFEKTEFEAVGGFDEDFTGEWSKATPKGYGEAISGYGFFDNHFVWKLIMNGMKPVVFENLRATEWMDDIVGKRIKRNDDQHAINKSLFRKKQMAPQPNGPILRFPWKHMFSHKR